MIRKKASAIPVLLAALLIMTACTGSNVIKPAVTSISQTSVPAVTEAPDTFAASVATLPEITSATAESAPPPVPSPSPVTSLRDGEYLILPGEGAYYNIFDSSGHSIGSFVYYDWESPSPVGVCDETTLTQS